MSEYLLCEFCKPTPNPNYPCYDCAWENVLAGRKRIAELEAELNALRDFLGARTGGQKGVAVEQGNP